MTKARLRIGIIGLGAMGTNHLRVLEAMPDVSIAAVADIEKERLEHCRVGHRIERAFTDYREMLEQASLDGVIIAVGPELHSEIAIECISRRIPCLLEKPIAATLEDAGKIVEAAERMESPCLIGHIERFNPVVRKAKSFIAENQVGTPYLCNTRRSGPFPRRLVHTGTGVLLDLAVHDVDIIQYLSGSRIEVVEAMFIRSETREIFAKVLYRCADDLAGSMEFSWISPRKIRDFQLYGTLGLIEGDYITQTLKFHENPDEVVVSDPWATRHLSAGRIASGRIIEYPIWRSEPLRMELEHFAEVIRGEAHPEIEPSEALRVMEVVERITKSGLANPTTLICDP